jgi:hypothetical protein
MSDYHGEIRGKIINEDEIKAGLQATRITNIEFDKPIDMYEGDELIITFTYTPKGMECDILLKTADGEEHVIGQPVQDIVESGPNERT